MNSTHLIISAIITLAISFVFTGMLIPCFRKKQFGQYIREEGPKSHIRKSGTPTMGGIAIIAAVTVGLLIYGFIGDILGTPLYITLITMIAFGVIGFVDDYAKVAKKDNLGLNAKQKLIMQTVIGFVIAIYMLNTKGGDVFIPFFKVNVDFGMLYVPFIMFVEIAMSNSVNLTDGLDGLAASTTTVVAVFFAVLGYNMGDVLMTASGLVLAAALIGFLAFNKHPAKIFMGDTGSMALGGLLSAIAIMGKREFLLPIAGLIYVLESISVIIQVAYFRKTGGQRFFKMAPIHHHFELSGMKEPAVVFMFSVFTMLCGIIAYISST